MRPWQGAAPPAAGNDARAKSSLRPLLVMFAVFAAPVLAAWFLYFNPEYLPSGRQSGEAHYPRGCAPCRPGPGHLHGGAVGSGGPGRQVDPGFF